MTGSMTINIIVTFAVLTVALAVGLILTIPDVPVGALLAVLFPLAVLVPVAIYPLTCTIWAAVELAMRPPDAAELADARRHLPG